MVYVFFSIAVPLCPVRVQINRISSALLQRRTSPEDTSRVIEKEERSKAVLVGLLERSPSDSEFASLEIEING